MINHCAYDIKGISNFYFIGNKIIKRLGQLQNDWMI